ncbi:hypothetical protein DCC62_18645 [candidate division KSB1 bacterium]|nr:MAG: hypothetical protein DCC62_18645 [candidate division KSB1 bacterium]
MHRIKRREKNMRLKLDMRSRENEKLLKISETMINAAQISQGDSEPSGKRFVAMLVRMPSATTEIMVMRNARPRFLNISVVLKF